MPGIRLDARGPDAGYSHPPASFLLLNRVREISLAIRVRAALDGAITGCDQRSGNARAMRVELRALGCTLENGKACSQSELDFVDDNLPEWQVDAATFRGTRLLANASCADVRALP